MASASSHLAAPRREAACSEPSIAGLLELENSRGGRSFGLHRQLDGALRGLN